MNGWSLDDVRRVRDALIAADYTVDGVAARLGGAAMAALHRHETVPADRASGAPDGSEGDGHGPGSGHGDGGDALGTLIRLFLLQRSVSRRVVAAALPIDLAARSGLIEVGDTDVRAAVDLRPYGEAEDSAGDSAEEEDAVALPHRTRTATGVSAPRRTAGGRWWVVSDLGTGLDGVHEPLPAEHVLGIGGASTTLAQLTPRTPVGRTLDVGTGCGVQALHASRHSREVVATDISTRALELAALTAALSGVELDLRLGNLLEPAGQSGDREGSSASASPYDLIVTNPPFVIGAPDGTSRHTYRDAGLPLDDVCAHLVSHAPAHLSIGGTLVMLANWVHRDGQPWDERVASWLPQDGVDALVVQREVLDPAEDVATWLRDAGERGTETYRARYDAWLAGLERERVDAIGFGFVVLRRSEDANAVTMLDWPHAVAVPLGPDVDAWLHRQRWLADHASDDALAASTLTLAADVLQEQIGRPGEEDPEHVVLRQQVGLRRAFAVDSATAALVGACDGSLPVGALVAAVEQVLGQETTGTAISRPGRLGQVRLMVEAGLLAPSHLTAPGILGADQRGSTAISLTP